MKTTQDLILRLLQRTPDTTTKVVIRTREGKLLPIEAVEFYREAKVPCISDDLNGPVAHNESLLVLDAGPPIRQRIHL